MKINEKDIIEQYSKGQRSFEDLELFDRVYDFRGASLAGISFSKSFLSADFSGADLRGSNFSRANVKTCDFIKADLRGSNFTEAALEEADFIGAKLDDANFEGATCYSKIFQKGEKPEN